MPFEIVTAVVSPEYKSLEDAINSLKSSREEKKFYFYTSSSLLDKEAGRRYFNQQIKICEEHLLENAKKLCAILLVEGWLMGMVVRRQIVDTYPKDVIKYNFARDTWFGEVGSGMELHEPELEELLNNYHSPKLHKGIACIKTASFSLWTEEKNIKAAEQAVKLLGFDFCKRKLATALFYFHSEDKGAKRRTQKKLIKFLTKDWVTWKDTKVEAANCHYFLGKAFFDLGDRQRALKNFVLANQLYDKLEKTKNPAKNDLDFGYFEIKESGLRKTMHEIALAHEKSENYGAAIKWYKKAKAVMPPSGLPENEDVDVARCLWHSGREAEALEQFSGVENDTALITTMLYLHETYAQLGLIGRIENSISKSGYDTPQPWLEINLASDLCQGGEHLTSLLKAQRKKRELAALICRTLPKVINDLEPVEDSQYRAVKTIEKKLPFLGEALQGTPEHNDFLKLREIVKYYKFPNKNNKALIFIQNKDMKMYSAAETEIMDVQKYLSRIPRTDGCIVELQDKCLYLLDNRNINYRRLTRKEVYELAKQTKHLDLIRFAATQ